MNNKKNWHKVNEKRARKGMLTVDKLRECRKEQGWTVDHRDVRANGVDLVAWIAQDPANPAKNRWYEIYEMTNWNINSYCTKERLHSMIKNLNSEESKILKEHQGANVIKIIVFNYRENLRKIGLEQAYHLTTENHIYMLFGNEIKLEEDEKIIDGWIE